MALLLCLGRLIALLSDLGGRLPVAPPAAVQLPGPGAEACLALDLLRVCRRAHYEASGLQPRSPLGTLVQRRDLRRVEALAV